MLVFPDDNGWAEAGSQFRYDAEWNMLKPVPEYPDKEIVSCITNQDPNPDGVFGGLRAEGFKACADAECLTEYKGDATGRSSPGGIAVRPILGDPSRIPFPLLISRLRAHYLHLWTRHSPFCLPVHGTLTKGVDT
jgi:hypothetical protein